MAGFIEVYHIPTLDYSKVGKDHKSKSNLRLINVDDISRIQFGTNAKFKDRAEIVMKGDDRRYDVVGTYDEIVERIVQAGNTVQQFVK